MISHDFKTIFVHIPKTGGTSIEAMFGFAEYDKFGLLTKDKVGKGKHWGAKEYYQYWEDFYKDYFKFTVVRNPWERDLSLYNMMKGQVKYRHLNFKQFCTLFAIFYPIRRSIRISIIRDKFKTSKVNFLN